VIEATYEGNVCLEAASSLALRQQTALETAAGCRLLARAAAHAAALEAAPLAPWGCRFFRLPRQWHVHTAPSFHSLVCARLNAGTVVEVHYPTTYAGGPFVADEFGMVWLQIVRPQNGFYCRIRDGSQLDHVWVSLGDTAVGDTAEGDPGDAPVQLQPIRAPAAKLFRGGGAPATEHGPPQNASAHEKYTRVCRDAYGRHVGMYTMGTGVVEAVEVFAGGRAARDPKDVPASEDNARALALRLGLTLGNAHGGANGQFARPPDPRSCPKGLFAYGQNARPANLAGAAFWGGTGSLHEMRASESVGGYSGRYRPVTDEFEEDWKRCDGGTLPLNVATAARVAQELGLQLGGAGSLDPSGPGEQREFAGDYLPKGLHAYASGEHAGVAFFGVGGSVLDMLKPVAPPLFRPLAPRGGHFQWLGPPGTAGSAVYFAPSIRIHPGALIRGSGDLCKPLPQSMPQMYASHAEALWRPGEVWVSQTHCHGELSSGNISGHRSTAEGTQLLFEVPEAEFELPAAALGQLRPPSAAALWAHLAAARADRDALASTADGSPDERIFFENPSTQLSSGLSENAQPAAALTESKKKQKESKQLAEINALYGRHDPENLAGVAGLVAEHGEERLLSMVRTKYAKPLPEPEAEVVAAAEPEAEQPRAHTGPPPDSLGSITTPATWAMMSRKALKVNSQSSQTEGMKVIVRCGPAGDVLETYFLHTPRYSYHFDFAKKFLGESQPRATVSFYAAIPAGIDCHSLEVYKVISLPLLPLLSFCQNDSAARG
jgi:hypothetical protein